MRHAVTSTSKPPNLTPEPLGGLLHVELQVEARHPEVQQDRLEDIGPVEDHDSISEVCQSMEFASPWYLHRGMCSVMCSACRCSAGGHACEECTSATEVGVNIRGACLLGVRAG